MTNHRMGIVVFATGMVALCATPGIAQKAQGTRKATWTEPTLPPNLEATRAALSRYQDPIVALRDGYLSTLGCIEFPAGGMAHGAMQYRPGAMGVHFINTAHIGPQLDSLKPQVLLYEWVGDRLRLVGAEWFVPTAVSKTAPTIFGQELQGPMEGHEPILPAELHHWDLHVWLWKDNPNGVFSPTNSAVKCPKGAAYTFQDKPPRMASP